MARQKKNEKGYFVKTFVFEGKRYYVYGKSQKELLEKAAKRRKELEEGEENHINPTLDSYYEYFTERRRNEQKGSTLRGQKIQYKTIAETIAENGKKFGELRIKDITARHIEMARQELLNQGKTPENLNICFAHLSHVFVSAMNDDTIEKNPCKALKRLKRENAPISETKHRALSEDERMAFFETSENRNSFYHNCLRLMLLTGMRIGEIGALYLTDIDDKYIHIRRTVTRDEIGAYHVGTDTKTDSGARKFPLDLNPEVREVIRKQKELNNMFFGFGWSGTLFQSSEGQLLREYTVNREIARICKEANIEKFTCHCLRSTFATSFIENHPDRYLELAYLMGHKTPKITFEHYTRVKPDEIVKIVNG